MDAAIWLNAAHNFYFIYMWFMNVFDSNALRKQTLRRAERMHIMVVIVF